ncbi:MAG: AraC family transcriptional regulator [Cellvibrio sp.]
MKTYQLLIDAAQRYARRHANSDGLAVTPVPGLRMMCLSVPNRKLQSVYRPLVCLVLQGRKQLLVGHQQQLCTAGESVIVSADMPVLGQVVEASATVPYVALAIELDMALLQELADEQASSRVRSSASNVVFMQNIDEIILDCSTRLMRLIDRPDAIPVLLPGIMKELHFWLLDGPNGEQLRALAAADSYPNRLRRAIAILRAEFQQRIPVERLAQAAAMGVTAFHKHFKQLTSLTPGQYQKRLRLIEARRLMLYQGSTASNAAYAVGYESVPHFTRDYRQMFGAPPAQDIRNTERLAHG